MVRTKTMRRRAPVAARSIGLCAALIALASASLGEAAGTPPSALPDRNPDRVLALSNTPVAHPLRDLPWNAEGADAKDRAGLTRLVAASAAIVDDGDSPTTAEVESGSTKTLPAAANAVTIYDSALTVLLRGGPDAAERKVVKNAVEAVFAGRLAEADRLDAQLTTPAAKKLLTWYRLQSGRTGASPEEIERFRRDNPIWPQSVLRAAAERALLDRATEKPANTVMAFFKDATPETPEGHLALAIAQAAKGKAKAARTSAQTAWFDVRLRRAAEEAGLEHLGDVLTAEDHRKRIDLLLMRDSRWKGTRRRQAAAVRRLVGKLDAPERAKIEARLAVFLRQNRGAAGRMAKLDDAQKADWGVYLKEVQRLRRTDKEQAAWEKLKAATTEPEAAVSLDDWWIERRVNAYNALYAKDYAAAYALVADPGPLSVNERNEHAFMAGWIAFRFLNDTKNGERHFRDLIASADGPRTRSRGNYWLARVLEARGKTKRARQHYETAAKEFNTYYGQIALQTIDPDRTRIAIPLREDLSPEVIARFQSRAAVRAVAIAGRAGLTNVTRRLLRGLRDTLKDEPGELALLAHLAVALGDTQMGVRIGKAGLFWGHDLAHWAYPTGVMPAYEPLRPPPETALLYAIARQESEFNTLIQSGAGAQGILQVMQITARHVCRQYRIRCRLNALKSDPAYNAQLASAYIGDRQSDYDGSLIMTFAGYNAGPGRVRYWVRNIGDPRDPAVDPIDWVELIHIKETRNYIQKVLSNLQVYRARLGDPETALRIRKDLVIARRS